MIKNRENEKGIVMYISLIVSGSLLVAAAVISSILIGEYKVSGDIQKSMEAVDASGSGLESILYQSRVNKNAFWSGGSVTSFTGDCKNFTGNMSVNTASINTDCSVNAQSDFTDNSSLSICKSSDPYTCTKISSTGTSGGYNRKLEILFQNR